MKIKIKIKTTFIKEKASYYGTMMGSLSTLIKSLEIFWRNS